MTKPRSLIIQNNCLAHVTFRCLNREFFLKPEKMKLYVLRTWERYATRYEIRIIDWIIMDNHCHLLVRVDDVVGLSNFMRTTNSLIARQINRTFRRDSHALRERFKSPMISTFDYLRNTIAYIWSNRRRAGAIVPPEDDKFCSLYYRLRGIDHALVPSYREVGIIDATEDERCVVQAFLEFMRQQIALPSDIYEHAHTVGDTSIVLARTLELRRLLPIWKEARMTSHVRALGP